MMDRRIALATTRAALAWVVMIAAATALAYFAAQGESVNHCLLGFGFVFAGGLIGMRRVAGQPFNIATMITFLWGATLGLWGPPLYGLSETLVNEQLVQPGLVSENWALELTQGFAMAAGSTITAFLLSFATGSTNVFFLTMVGSALAGAASLLPIPDRVIIPAAALIWQVLVQAGLAQWAVACVRRDSRGCCPRCARDIVGISSPVCPSCALPLSNLVPYGSTCEIAKGSPRPHGLG